MELTRESWSELTDEEKTAELQKIIPGADYAEYRKDYERLKGLGRADFFTFDKPVVVLELIDPIMASELASWMYRRGDKLNNIPVFGYKLVELTFDKASLMGFSKEEQSILHQAIHIIQSKFAKNE